MAGGGGCGAVAASSVHYGQRLTRGGTRVVNNATSLSLFLSSSLSNLFRFFIGRLDLETSLSTIFSSSFYLFEKKHHRPILSLFLFYISLSYSFAQSGSLGWFGPSTIGREVARRKGGGRGTSREA